MNSPKAHRGRVISNYGARLLVRDDEGKLHRCVSLKKLGLVVTGDTVDWQTEKTGDGKVVRIHPRDSLLQRPDRKGKLKPVAANLTRLVIVSAIKPGVETLLIDQYAAAAELAGIEPLIVINKSDLLDEESRKTLKNTLAVYKNIGYHALFISCSDDDGVRPLRENLSQQVSILVGQSGVGKSSIVKQLFPDLDIQIGALSEASGSGAHTTTVTSWYDLPSGGALIDSPGVRQFSLENLTQTDLAKGFREISNASDQCRFNNCTHLHEPDCAVQDAIAAGEISEIRFQNYKKLVTDNAAENTERF